LINVAENVTIGTFVTLETKVTIVTRKLYVKLATKIVKKCTYQFVISLSITCDGWNDCVHLLSVMT